jgi:acyl-CoA synthetase (AMP-forming)/AMP-acid ligase II
MTNILEQVRPRAIVAASRYRRRHLPEELDQALSATGLNDVARLVAGTGSAGWLSMDAAGPGALPSSARPGSPANPCLVLFTSGTESAAKAVLHSPAALHHELRSTITEWGLTFRDSMFMASPMTHITGLLQGFLLPARVGASAVLMDHWNGDEAVDLIEKTGASYMAGAAPFLRELLAGYRASSYDRSSLRQYCCGGAAVSPALITGADDLGIAAYRAWGMTELPTSTLANELDPLELRATTDGRLAPGVELRVVDESGDVLPVASTGELHLRGPEMLLGYLRAEHNDTAFTEDGWLRTGDLGSLGEDGFVRITGRLKEIINRGGEKFSAREIEDAVLQHPQIGQVAVVAVPGGRLGEQIAAAVVSDRKDLTIEEVGRAVTGAGLSKHKQPERLLVLDCLPTNATGKTDKNRIVALFRDESA